MLSGVSSGATIRRMRREFSTAAALIVVVMALGAVAAAAGGAQRTARRGGSGPGVAQATITGGTIMLANAAVAGRWKIDDDRFQAVSFEDRQNGRTIPLPPGAFSLVLEGGRVIHASDMKITAAPLVETLTEDPKASRLVERLPGRRITVSLQSAEPALRVT